MICKCNVIFTYNKQFQHNYLKHSMISYTIHKTFKIGSIVIQNIVIIFVHIKLSIDYQIYITQTIFFHQQYLL